jgi:hypothetical protein
VESDFSFIDNRRAPTHIPNKNKGPEFVPGTELDGAKRAEFTLSINLCFLIDQGYRATHFLNYARLPRHIKIIILVWTIDGLTKDLTQSETGGHSYTRF